MGADLWVVGGIIVCCIGAPMVGVPMILFAVIAAWNN